MTVGTLRDQIIYPHLAEECRRRGSVDTDLEDILNQVWTVLLFISFVVVLTYCDCSQTLHGSSLANSYVK